MYLCHKHLSLESFSLFALTPARQTDLHHIIQTLFKHGLSKGTWRNKCTQFQKYINFCNDFNINKKFPKQYDLMMYLAYLSKSLKSPSAVYNYFSGAKTYVLLMRGKAKVFNSYSIGLVKKGVSNLKNVPVMRAFPLKVKHIIRIYKYFKSLGSSAQVLNVALLIGYFTLLRQSNLFFSESPCDPGHYLTGDDIRLNERFLRVRVRSTKTTRRQGQTYYVCLPRVPGSSCCPVRIWKRYAAATPISKSGPALLLRTGEPLMAHTFLLALRLAGDKCGLQGKRLSVHSLRRGAARECAVAGVPLEQVQELGNWRSSCIYNYVNKRSFKTGPSALASLFG